MRTAGTAPAACVIAANRSASIRSIAPHRRRLAVRRGGGLGGVERALDRIAQLGVFPGLRRRCLVGHGRLAASGQQQGQNEEHGLVHGAAFAGNLALS